MTAARLLRRPLSLSLALALCAASAAAQSLPSASSLLGPSLLQEARSGKALRMGKEPSLLPRCAAGDSLGAAIREAKAPLLVESLFLLPRPAPADAEAERARIARILCSFSSLQGISYYSQSLGRVATLFTKSYLVGGPDSRSALPDPPLPAPGASLVSWVFQEERHFGGNVYRYLLSQPEGALGLDCSNASTLWLGPVPAVKAGRMGCRLLVVPASDALVIYCASTLDASPLLSGKLKDSFANRADALFAWFKARWAL